MHHLQQLTTVWMGTEKSTCQAMQPAHAQTSRCAYHQARYAVHVLLIQRAMQQAGHTNASITLQYSMNRLRHNENLLPATLQGPHAQPYAAHKPAAVHTVLCAAERKAWVGFNRKKSHTQPHDALRLPLQTHINPAANPQGMITS
jgi:hypothetical protein